MTPRFLLHIGRHKTGTSSLQHFLFTNRDRLESHGYYYPRAGLAPVAHHDVARFLHAKQRLALPAAERQMLAQAMRALAVEVAGKPQTVLLSSEAFQNLQPHWVAARFEPGRTRVVVYLREQVDYLVSSYQQKVHATNYAESLHEYLAKVVINYDAFLGRWERSYGIEHVDVRAYHRSRLLNGDIIADFTELLGFDSTVGFEPAADDHNPSIGGALLELKRHLNRRLTDTRTPLAIYKAFSRVAGAESVHRRKPYVEPAVAVEVRRSAEASNRRVFDRHFDGIDVFAESRCHAVERNGEPVDATALLEALDSVVRELPALRELLSSLRLDGALRDAAESLRPNLY